MQKSIGRISQVIGAVIDVCFDAESKNESVTVRTVAMDRTAGLSRGMEVVATGQPITMPVGNQIKGRMMNVVGEAIDGMKELDKDGAYPIHREPPKFDELSTVQEVLYTGIKLEELIKHGFRNNH